MIITSSSHSHTPLYNPLISQLWILLWQQQIGLPTLYNLTPQMLCNHSSQSPLFCTVVKPTLMENQPITSLITIVTKPNQVQLPQSRLQSTLMAMVYFGVSNLTLKSYFLMELIFMFFSVLDGLQVWTQQLWTTLMHTMYANIDQLTIIKTLMPGIYPLIILL